MTKPEILFDCDDFIIAVKPADTGFHNYGEQEGFFSRLESHYGKKLWPVHRLDKVTSGLLIFARNQSTARQFQQLFESHQVEKCYIALTDRKPRKKQGMIKGDMEISRNGDYKLCRTTNNPAITRFKSQSLKPRLRLFWLLPQTGKTHQLRVMMKSIGAPIIGDKRYKGSDSDRCYLHAFALRFSLNGKKFEFINAPTSGALFSQLDEQIYTRYQSGFD